MAHSLSRRTFVKAMSNFMTGATVVGSAAFLNNIQTAHAQVSSTQWMKALNDSTKVSRLTLPGTHDTCSLRGGPITACQTRSLHEQLAAGIRFIDIRCRHINNIFAIHHGSVYQGINFGAGVRDVCVNFLQTNPSECIIMSVKEEYTPSGNTRTFEDTFDWYLQGFENSWYPGDSIPTMKDVRGKIVLLRRFSAVRLPKGTDASAWQDNATFEIQTANATLEVQDNYNVPNFFPSSINGKWGYIQTLLDRAKSDASDMWYLNFLSGASLLAYPDFVAGQINPRLYNYLGTSFSNRVGILAMDFPDDNLIGRIIGINGV
ncbi:MAG: phosphatidylinositol-specific phospholipase C [Ktedonobacteraceae bacterium]|nr:phosphatidylinositol-specific phospholipase C [Ktedonobacteraceae bacterium]